MKTKNFLIIFLFAWVSFSFAQEVTYEKVKRQFESFEYENVIKFSGQLIANGNLSDSLLIDLHLMRAQVFYSNNDEVSTRKSFENILEIKRNYTPDQSIISPKLISIFNEVKVEFFRNHPEQIQPKDSTQHNQEIKSVGQLSMKSAALKNVLIPGLGQLHFGNRSKGWVITSASILNLGAMIYFIFDTKSKEDIYLKETDKILIAQKYDDYNRSYRIRNTLIISYAVIWVFSQLDLLFFTEEEEMNLQQTSFSIEKRSPFDDFRLSFRVPF